MIRDGRRDLPKGITPKLRKHGTRSVPVTTADGTPVYRVRLWDPVLKRQIERTAEGLDAAKKLLADFNEAKRRPGRLQAEHIRFADVAARYLVAYKIKRDGTPRPKSSLAKERTCLNVYILPALGNAWIGDLDLPELNDDHPEPDSPGRQPRLGQHQEHGRVRAAPALRLGTRGTHHPGQPGARTAYRLGRIGPTPGHHPQHPAGAPAGRRARPVQAGPRGRSHGLGLHRAALGRSRGRADRQRQTSMPRASRIDRTASESGGRRDVREDMKTRAAERTVMIPDIAMPAVRRLVDRGAPGREHSDGKLYGRLINGDRGGYLGYAMWRRYLKLAQGYTAAHPDGIVSYTAHELRHVCASLLIASGASDIQVAHQMGHSRIETTKNIYGHLFAQDRTSILDAMNQAVSRLYAYESQEPGADADANAVA